MSKIGKTTDMIEQEAMEKQKRNHSKTASILRNEALNSSYMNDIDKERPTSVPREFISFRRAADEN